MSVILTEREKEMAREILDWDDEDDFFCPDGLPLIVGSRKATAIRCHKEERREWRDQKWAEDKKSWKVPRPTFIELSEDVPRTQMSSRRPRRARTQYRSRGAPPARVLAPRLAEIAAEKALEEMRELERADSEIFGFEEEYDYCFIEGLCLHL